MINSSEAANNSYFPFNLQLAAGIWQVCVLSHLNAQQDRRLTETVYCALCEERVAARRQLQAFLDDTRCARASQAWNQTMLQNNDTNDSTGSHSEPPASLWSWSPSPPSAASRIDRAIRTCSSSAGSASLNSPHSAASTNARTLSTSDWSARERATTRRTGNGNAMSGCCCERRPAAVGRSRVAATRRCCR